MKWVKSKAGGTHVLNVAAVVRFEGVLIGPVGPERRAVLRAYFVDVEGKEYGVLFSTLDIQLGVRLLDDLIVWLGDANANGIYDVEARALTV